MVVSLIDKYKLTKCYTASVIMYGEPRQSIFSQHTKQMRMHI